MGGKSNYERVKRYQDKAYDQALIRFAKGQKEEIKAAAERHGKSLNAFVVEAVKEKMEREKKGGG